jgi:sortase A
VSDQGHGGGAPSWRDITVRPYHRRRDWRWWVGGIGRVLVAAGLLLLAFVGYQLWGTGIQTRQAQHRLEQQFADVVAASPTTTTTTTPPTTEPGTTTTAPPTTPAPPPSTVPPAEGDPVARLQAPSIGLDWIVVSGVGVDDLKKGPGHYPDSPLPGQPGNAAIAGHRTTYGAPFNRLDELGSGDEILVTTVQGSFRYEVREQLIVSPDQVEVLDDFGDDRLTLTACHPKYSARQRIVIVAALVGDAAPAPATPPSPGPAPSDDGDNGDNAEAGGSGGQTLDAGLGGERATAWPAVLLGVACGFIWLAAWLLGQLWRKWPAYLVCLPVFLVVLFFFFENFSRLLPANF